MQVMPSSTGPSLQTSHDVDIDVRGLVPPTLSGRLIGIGPRGVVHSVEVRPGRSVTYRSRRIRPEVDVHHVVAFSGTTLAFGDDLPAFELSAALDTLRPVDLAGQGRPLAPFPKHDPTTGELHVIAGAVGETQAHVVVSAGALTRRNRPIVDTPNHIKDLALTRDRVVFVADGFIGIASREGEGRTTWIATGVAAPYPVHAHDAGDTVVLRRAHPDARAMDAAPRQPAASSARCWIRRLDASPTAATRASTGRRACCGPRATGPSATTISSPRATCTTTSGRTCPATSCSSPTRRDRATPTVAGSSGSSTTPHGATTELRVIDAADIAAPPIATARIPRPIPHGLRCTWIPSTQ